MTETVEASVASSGAKGVSQSSAHRRMQFMGRHFGFPPESRKELRWAVQGLPYQIERAHQFGLRDEIDSILDEVKSFRMGSQETANLLGGYANFISARGVISPERLLKDQLLITVLARIAMFDNALANNRWPRLTPENTDRRLDVYRREVANPDEIESRIASGYNSATLRATFWFNQLVLVSKMPELTGIEDRPEPAFGRDLYIPEV